MHKFTVMLLQQTHVVSNNLHEIPVLLLTKMHQSILNSVIPSALKILAAIWLKTGMA